MINLTEELKNVRTVAIAGHIRPDGDSIGACVALYHYLHANYPEIEATVYLENVLDAYKIIPGVSEICHDFNQDRTFDLFFCLDCADEQRLGDAVNYKQRSARTICIDHHISNQGFGDVNYIVPDASSTAELVFTILEEGKIPFESAEALYMGIVHDTGVFRHSCTSPETLEIAAKLMRKGIDCSKITNYTYYDKTYRQNQILAKAIMESTLFMDEKVIFSPILLKDMEFYGVKAPDLDGIVEILMGTTGVEAAIFIHEISPQTYKVSLRSKEIVDVSLIATYYGGGGHVRAAGFNIQGSVNEVANELTMQIARQLQQVKDSD